MVAKKRRGHDRDFPRLVQIIRNIAPDVSPLIVRDRLHHSFYPQALFRPTLTVCFDTLNHLTPLRGSICQNRILPKSEEYRRLERNSIPVPAWQLLDEHTSPDLSRFHGDYVVVKPDLGAKGAEVKIKRKTRVRWRPSQTARAIKIGHQQSLVQQFIYTGSWPTSYRVTTLFGRVLFAWRVEASRDRRPLAGPEAFRGGEQGGGISISSSGRESRFTLCYEKDVLDLGIQAHASFEDFPLLGTDIVRDATTGKLYVLEVNSCGSVWHFSSETGLSIQRDHELDFEKQFGGLHVAAEALVEQVHRRAV
jgi:hypothetical protein